MTSIASWQSIALLIVLAAIGYAAAHGLWRHGAQRRPAAAAPDGFGLPTLAAAAGACALLFTALTAALLAGDFIGPIDAAIRHWVQMLHDDAFVRLATFITSMANVETVIAVTLVAAGLLWAQAPRPHLAGLVISVIGSQAATYMAKYAIGRERPQFESFASAATPSFPSAHASAAVAAYGFIVYVIVRRLPAGRARFEVTYWGSLFIVLIAASRIVLGVHYASDVLGGLLLGLFWLLAGCIASRSRRLSEPAARSR